MKKLNEKEMLISSLYAISICDPVFFKKNETYKINGRTLRNMSKLLRLLKEDKKNE